MKPIVAIVGRPNVGKSTLFNRLIGRRKAITKDEPGVTRDLNYADCDAWGTVFTLVDTGGFEPAVKEGILKQVREQALFAVEEADLTVFLMDGRDGLTPADIEIGRILRESNKPVIYAVNKIDIEKLLPDASEFYSLGVKKIMCLSSEHGSGVGELIDEITGKLPKAPLEAPPEADETGEDVVKVAIVGRPNVGKSSLLNKLIGKERVIVSSIAGTTRDAIDTLFDKDGKKYLFIDTAGIRKKSRITMKLEAYCVVEAIKSIERANIALLVIDGMEGLKSQEEKIGGLIEDRGKCCVIVVNKWDIVEKDSKTASVYEERIRGMMPFLSYAPIVFVSALSGQRVSAVFDVMARVVVQATTKFQTSKLNKCLEEFVARHHPPAYAGKEVKLYYVTQTRTMPPAFTIFVNRPEGIVDSYKRYLVNSFRESLSLNSAPLRISFRKRR